MLGFAYEVPENLRSPGFATRTYERIRQTRPRVIDWLRQVHRANTAYNNIGDRTVVYVAVNKVNNKLYVGVTKSLRMRMRQHYREAKRANPSGMFARAIRKYGSESFDFLVIGAPYSYERALFSERELIADIMPEYNLTAGGEGMMGWKPSNETLKRLSESHVGLPGYWAGKTRSIESLEKMVATRMARGNYIGPRRGEKRSAEEREKIKLGRKNGKKPRPLSAEMIERRSIRFTAMNIAKSRPVKCIEDGLIFPSIKAAASHYKIGTSQLGRAVHGEAKSAHGLHFQFA